MGQDCIFCKIDIGEIPSQVLYRDDLCFVIRDIVPRAPVHLLIVPRRHFTFLTGLTGEDDALMGAMFRAARDMARRERVEESGYRLVINQREDAGQGVDHLHLHLLAGHQLGGMA